MNPSQNNNILKVIIGIIVVAIPASIIAYFSLNNSSTTSNQNPPVPPPTSTTTQAVSTTTPSYKDGTYTAEGDYFSPGGAEDIEVSLTLSHNVITDATVTPEATRATSVHFQGIFVANYKQYVIGQNISNLQLSKVSGSSLTPKGFNDALTKIKAEAAIS